MLLTEAAFTDVPRTCRQGGSMLIAMTDVTVLLGAVGALAAMLAVLRAG